MNFTKYTLIVLMLFARCVMTNEMSDITVNFGNSVFSIQLPNNESKNFPAWQDISNVSLLDPRFEKNDRRIIAIVKLGI